MDERVFPNLFLVGAMKSGSTSLHDAIGMHPQIWMTSYKEPQYFAGSLDTEQGWFDSNPLPDPEGHWYFALFDKARDDPRVMYAGESSTDYTKRPTFEGCAERIRGFNPKARILCILRDPIDRCISHYWHNVRICQERREMIEAIRRDPTLIAFSDYAMQLEPYWDAFPREQIHVLTLESFCRDRNNALRAIFEWLDVDATVSIPSLESANVTSEIIYRTRFGMSWLARLLMTRRWRKVARCLPRPVAAAPHWLATHQVARAAFSRNDAVEFLRPIMAEKAEAFFELVGRSYPEWKTTFPDGVSVGQHTLTLEC